MGTYEDIADDDLSVAQLIELEEGEADDDQERAQRINASFAEKMREVTEGLSSRMLAGVELPTTGVGTLSKAIAQSGATSALQRAMAPTVIPTPRLGLLPAIEKMKAQQATSGLTALTDKLNASMPSLTDMAQSSGLVNLVGRLNIARKVELPALAQWERPFDASPLAKVDIDLPTVHSQRRFAEVLRRDEDEVSRRLDEVSAAVQVRDEHKFEAEQAAIDTSKLLDALVGLSEAQQAQLVNQGTLLQAMVEQTATLTAHTLAQAQQDEARWKKSLRLQKLELIAGIIAALLAGAAIWAAFAASKPVVVKVPAPIVGGEASTTSIAPTPASRSAE